MENVIQEYKNLKKELDENYSTDRSDEDFSKLVTMKNVDPDLKETLILLHSNYKTENQAQKTYIKKTMLKLIDNEIESLTKVQVILENKIKDESGNSLLQTTGLQKLFILVGLLVFGFFIMAIIDKDAFKEAAGSVRDLLPGINSIQQTQQQQPASSNNTQNISPTGEGVE